jgi:ABC-type bacteriocin/lantibiotic exporter with double-glycine peptidase domain
MTADTDGTRLQEALRTALAVANSPAGHEVHAQIARIAEAYGETPSDGPCATQTDPAIAENDVLLSHLAATISPTTPAEACLVPALAAMGWTGVVRDVREALPYYDRIRDVEALRGVLAHLNYQTHRTPINLANIRVDMMPCLFSTDGVSAWLVVERGPSGELLLFDGGAGNWRLADDVDIEGTAYPITAQVNEQARSIHEAWLNNVISRFTPLILKVLLLSFIVNLSVLALPLFVIQVYDRGIGARATDVVLYFCVGALIVIGTDQALRRVRARALAYFGARLDAIIAVASFQQLLQMPIFMTDSAPIGTQISRLRQFESIRNVFIGTLATTIVDIPFILVFLAAIAFIGGHLVWIPLLLLAAYGVMSAITMRLTRSHVAQCGNAKTNLEHLMFELIGKRTTIRELSAERIWIARHDELAELFAKQNHRAQVFNGFIQSLAQSLVGLAGICTLGFGALLVMSGGMSTGALIGTMALVWCVLMPLQTTFLTVNRLEQAIQTFKHVNRLMGIEVERNLDEKLSFHRKFKGGISLNRLVFRYPGATEPVLRGIQLQIAPGEVIAITGTSGAGKSTLLKLIAGLYPATAGAVLADGLDIRQLDPAEWRSAVANAPQTASFFHGTLSQNLRLACPDASDADIARTASELGLDMDAGLFPEGLETRLSTSSLGQLPDAVKQRLLLARCFVKRTSLYLLDMPAVNLDTAGDAALVAKIRELRGRATVIFTTYRPSHMRLADRVIVLASGQVAMEGPAEKVVEKLAAAA